jgi:HSP20 family protein
VDPAGIDVNLDRGVLTISGERKPRENGDEKTTVHMDERFSGRFRRVVNLPEDIDPNAVSADYRDGVLHVSIARRAAAQPRRIEVH